MAELLFDTSFLIDVLNDQRGRAELMEKFINQNDKLACCPIVVSGIYAGLRRSEEKKTEALLSQFIYIPISWKAAKLAGQLKQQWARRGKTLSLTDTTIAAVCLTEGLTLVTSNQKHFPMPDLSLYPLPAGPSTH